MLCSSCASQMSSTNQTQTHTGVQQEHRCPKCGDQCIRSDLVLEGEDFEIDPFINYQMLTRQTAQSSGVEEQQATEQSAR